MAAADEGVVRVLVRRGDVAGIAWRRRRERQQAVEAVEQVGEVRQRRDHRPELLGLAGLELDAVESRESLDLRRVRRLHAVVGHPLSLIDGPQLGRARDVDRSVRGEHDSVVLAGAPPR